MTPPRPPAEPGRVTSIRATVRHGTSGWQVAWLPSEGWFCVCPGGRRHCPHIVRTRAILAALEAAETERTEGEPIP